MSGESCCTTCADVIAESNDKQYRELFRKYAALLVEMETIKGQLPGLLDELGGMADTLSCQTSCIGTSRACDTAVERATAWAAHLRGEE